MRTSIALAALVASVAAKSINFPISFPHHKRQDIEPGTPEYECHANCGTSIFRNPSNFPYEVQTNTLPGGVITLGRTTGYCDNEEYASDLQACLECALVYNIWQYYGTSVTKAATACGDSATPISAASSAAASSAAAATTPASAVESSVVAVTSTPKAASPSSSPVESTVDGGSSEVASLSTSATAASETSAAAAVSSYATGVPAASSSSSNSVSYSVSLNFYVPSMLTMWLFPIDWYCGCDSDSNCIRWCCCCPWRQCGDAGVRFRVHDCGIQLAVKWN